MIAELGIFFLVLTLVISSFGFISPLLNKFSFADLCQLNVSRLSFLFTLLSFFALTFSFVISDFSLSTVQKNSNSELPLIYKITGVWGNHEGSILLWLLVMTFFGFILSIQKNINSQIQKTTLNFQNSLIFLVSSFIIFTSNPFERSFPPAVEGADLNPLLQDPGLIIHPPFLYLGYVGFSIVYSMSLATLLQKKTSEFLKYLRPWIFISWTFLTCGIGLGSWWAYYELGWGGFWFWDPVENASLLPWLTGSALLHTIVISSKSNHLQNWTIFLSIITFLLSLLGTFLVRSGVLVSVHAFANDPTRGLFILLLLLIVSAIGFFLFIRQEKSIEKQSSINLISREGAISLNNIFMLTISFTILLGTLYPLFSNIFFQNKISVGAPFFNSILSPLIFPMAIGMVFGPFLKWKKDDLFKLLDRLKILIILLFIISLFVWYISYEGPVLSIILFVFAAFVILSSSFEFTKAIKFKPKITFKKIPLKRISQSIAHIGIALIIIGATGTSILKQEKIQFQDTGGITLIKDFKIQFKGVKMLEGQNYLSQMGRFDVYKKDVLITSLFPEKRKYNSSRQITTEAAIYSTLLGDLYIAIGDQNELNENSWTTRIWFNPFTSWIWIGVFFLVFSGLISVIRTLKKES